MADPHRIDVSTRVEKTHRVCLDDEDIREILKQKYNITIPAKALSLKVFVEVPGGGDWSGQELEIDDDTQIQVVWRTVEES